jgi:predicted outer membrane repeat protein
VTISDCTVSDNTAPGDGGGIACGTGTITDCTVSGNVAAGRGGGVFGSASLMRSTITANEARSGGGIYCSGGSPIVEHCVVVSNVASGIFAGEGTGGGIHCQSASPTLINCLLARNIAANDGGGVYAGRAVLASCTVAGNTAVFLGGGLCVNTGTDYRTDARNCVFWGNSGCAGTQFAAIGPAELRVAYSDAQGGPDAVYLHEGAELLWGWGNVQTDPLFRDPQADDYRLGPGSPCVDAGDNFGALTALDLDGNPRRLDQPSVPDTGLGEPPIVDMGAYEMQVRLVTQPGDANCDGGVDFDDINPFVRALIGQTTYEAAYPKCAWLNADCNGDGTVDFDDINPFVKCLVHGGCP